MSPPLRLAAECPRCRTRPRWRIHERERDRYAEAHPEEEVATHQCHKCGAIYAVRARDYQRAA